MTENRTTREFAPTMSNWNRGGMEGRMSKLGLQIVMGLLGIIPVATGLLGLLGVEDPFYVAVGVPPIVMLDSNLRFYSGVWLGLGLGICWLIPRIERHTVLFRVVWAMIFIGGIGRLLSMTLLAWPPVPFVGFTALEIVGAPLFILWKSRLSKLSLRHIDDDLRASSSEMIFALRPSTSEASVLARSRCDHLQVGGVTGLRPSILKTADVCPCRRF